jgi:hypothetical protein
VNDCRKLIHTGRFVQGKDELIRTLG